MRRVRVLAGTVAAAAALTAAVLVAPPASAATQNIQVDCTSDGDGVLTVSPGDVISITSSTTPCDYSGTNVPDYENWFSSYTGGFDFDPGSEPFVWVVSPNAPLGATDSLICVGIGTCTYFISFDVVSGVSVETPVIPPWVQAYGRSGPDATCEDGWTASWQEWAVPVTGGWVCTREVPSLG